MSSGKQAAALTDHECHGGLDPWAVIPCVATHCWQVKADIRQLPDRLCGLHSGSQKYTQSIHRTWILHHCNSWPQDNLLDPASLLYGANKVCCRYVLGDESMGLVCASVAHRGGTFNRHPRRPPRLNHTFNHQVKYGAIGCKPQSASLFQAQFQALDRSTTVSATVPISYTRI